MVLFGFPAAFFGRRHQALRAALDSQQSSALALHDHLSRTNRSVTMSARSCHTRNSIKRLSRLDHIVPSLDVFDRHRLYSDVLGPTSFALATAESMSLNQGWSCPSAD